MFTKSQLFWPPTPSSCKCSLWTAPKYFFFFFLDMFFHIANIEREVYWQIGNVCCSAYPIEQLDTINSSTGELNTQSALNLIVFGVSSRFLHSTHATFILTSFIWAWFSIEIENLKCHFFKFTHFPLFLLITMVSSQNAGVPKANLF